MNAQDIAARPPAAAPSPALSWTAVAVAVPVLAQLALATTVVFLYDIENPAFQRVFVLATAGFVINLALPLAYRLRFFVALSIAGVFVVFAAADAVWLLAAGLSLIAIGNLPLSLSSRVGVLVVLGIALAVARAGFVDAPWSAAVWPILGSMFMFRLALYLWTIKSEPRQDRWWWPVAYFFMLPNLVFPLFPVVDYQTFRRTFYDKPQADIYHTGMLWIARGLLHLVLYRIVYHNVLGDPESVFTLGDLVQFMLGTFLLYLRVSGQFHLIVGLLHLFGFRLPETHKLYYLAHSFTELWRRINIYWTDFMMKTVFYPVYFRLKRLGPMAALVWSTTAVFVTTWLLHSYQWFWLRGGFPLTAQDTLFWAILGAFVVAGAVKELRASKKAVGPAKRWDWRLGLHAATTFTIFCVLWSLWSTDSVSRWVWMLGAVANPDWYGVGLVAATFAIVAFLGGFNGRVARQAAASRFPFAAYNTLRPILTLLFLVVAAQPVIEGAAPVPLQAALRSMRTSGLNARDLALQHRGYYEQLDIRAQLDAPIAAGGAARTAWQMLSDLDVLNDDRRDAMLRDLRPSQHTTWNGNAFSTNRWGMRDREYDVVKPPGTLRIAFLGPSHVMGNGVADHETFENLLEQRLNASMPAGRYSRVEILNFAVDGYSLPQQLALLQDRVFRFSPDLVVATHYKDNFEMTESFLQKIVERRIAVSDPVLLELMEQSGLTLAGARGVPVPYQFARELAGRMGIETRMPYGEMRSRIRRITNQVLAESFAQFAAITRAQGVAAAVLALNVVLDEVPREVPLRDAIAHENLPLIDLFDVFPSERRAALRVAPWDDHPNAAGHALIAERLLPTFSGFAANGTFTLNEASVSARLSRTSR